MPPLTVATVAPARLFQGRLQVPGDKSISHRYAIVAALAEGSSSIAGYAPGADCRSTLNCLRQLGVEIAQQGDTVSVHGRGLGGLRAASAALDAGNSGTTMRLMAGVLAGHPFRSVLIGDASLSRRPMRRVIAPLERMGARIDATDGHAPLTITGGALRPLAHVSDVPSAQVKSSILLAGLLAEGVTSVTEPAQTRDHTEQALSAFGATLTHSGPMVSVAGRQRLLGRAVTVPGDFSSAAFWMVAAAASPGSRVHIENVGLNPTRIGLIDVLRRFGARVQIELTGTDAGEPRGSILVEGDRAGSLRIEPEEVPALIDELPAIAALAARGGEVIVRGAGELRVKESDRIAVLVAGFRSLGFPAEEQPDGFTVRGPAPGAVASGGVADARGDHRMAMAFAIAALAAREPSTIEGADSVGISYPGFFDTLDRIVSSRDGFNVP